MKWITILLTGLAAVTPTISADDGKQCQSLLEKGDKLYSDFQNKEALEAYRTAHEQCPGRYEPLMKYTRALNDVGEDTGDHEYYRKSLERAKQMKEEYPDSMMAWFLAAASAANLADNSGPQQKVKLSSEVNENIRKTIAMDSAYAPAHVVLGGYLQRVATTGDFVKGLARMFLGDVPEASLEESEAHLRTALELEPRNMFAHLELGRTLISADRVEEARKHLQEVLDLPVTNHQHPELKEEARQLMESTS